MEGFLKELVPQKINIGKNVMLWMTEKYPPESAIWEDPVEGIKNIY